MVTRKPLPDSSQPSGRQDSRDELWTNIANSEGSPREDNIWGEPAGPSPAAGPGGGGQAGAVPDFLRPGPPLQPRNYSATSSMGDDEQSAWAAEPPKRLSPAATGASAVSAGSADINDVPASLRPGGPSPNGGGSRAETNPFLRRKSAGGQEGGPGISTPLYQQHSGNTGAAPPPIPAPPLTAAFTGLSLASAEAGTNPWRPAPDERQQEAQKPTPAIYSVPPAPQDGDRDDPWSSRQGSRQPSAGPGPRNNNDSPALISLPSEGESAGWDDTPPSQKGASTGGSAAAGAPPPIPPPKGSVDAEEEMFEGQHAWDDVDGGQVNKGKTPVKPSLLDADLPGAADAGWDLIDPPSQPVLVPGAISRSSTWENFSDDEAPRKKLAPPPDPVSPLTPADHKMHTFPDVLSGAASSAPAADGNEEAPPALPPRTSADNPPPKPPRPTNAPPETYQIKNIAWYDINAAENPRISPILVQNANGPCPLVALVNALTLTTPAELTNTVLVETLQLREQISLGLLLEAVFDELMSSRRTTTDGALPDVTELYAFLKGLDTGMNVNPRFVPTPDLVKAFKRTSLAHIHPSERGDVIPGTFEDTREMRLYATFSIPLIHGWLPPPGEAVYEALARRAASYEDAQNLLFREEELEDKLANSALIGLSDDEQQLYQDILTIKSWLAISATQLTQTGLDIITKAMLPGAVAILFRNDHFATLYRHPQTLELFTLVTDAGYATHDEIVWESLVDVNGEHTEFFSGDLRLVGGAQQQPQDEKQGTSEKGGGRLPGQFPDHGGAGGSNNGESSHSGGGGSSWTTVLGRRNKNGKNGTPRLSTGEATVGSSSNAARQNEPAEPLSPNHEQEDHDLALALMLQEEEDERHRVEEARRRRESLLSEQYIEQQGRQLPLTPAAVRGGSRAGAGAGVRDVTVQGPGGRGQGGNGSGLRGGGGGGPISPGRRTSSVTTATITTPSPRNPPRAGIGRGVSSSPSASSREVSGIITNPSHHNPTTAPAPARGPQVVRPLVPPVTHRPADDLDADAPPSYEQAARQIAYVPPAGHPSHPTSSPQRAVAAAAVGTTGTGGGGAAAPVGPRRSSVAAAAASSNASLPRLDRIPTGASAMSDRRRQSGLAGNPSQSALASSFQQHQQQQLQMQRQQMAQTGAQGQEGLVGGRARDKDCVVM